MARSGPEFGVRFFKCNTGYTGVVYRRGPAANGSDRLQRTSRISALAVSAGANLIRQAVDASSENARGIASGPVQALNSDWGPRVACYALVAEGLRDVDMLATAAAEMRVMPPDEAAWWLGQISVTSDRGMRARRALRILIGAVK